MPGMGITVPDLAGDLCVAPGEILVLVGAFPPAETGAWEEEEILPAIWWPEIPGEESLPPA
jgi:hypothetical protein